jgi:glyoxylase I family protein
MSLDIRGVCPLIQVYDTPTSLAFYCDVLGFTIVSQSPPGHAPDWVLLRLDRAELMLNTRYEANDRPPAPDPARAEAHDDTILYFGSPDVDAVYRQLREKGLDVPPPKVAPYGMKQLYLKDPDGYGLCFQWKA